MEIKKICDNCKNYNVAEDKCLKYDHDVGLTVEECFEYPCEVKPFHKCLGKEYSLIEDSHFNYCPYCGRKIKWNEL